MVWQSLEGWIPGLGFQRDRRGSGEERGRDPPDRRNGSVQAVGDLKRPGVARNHGSKVWENWGVEGRSLQSCHKVSECKRCAHTWPKTQQQEEGGPRAGQTRDSHSVMRLHGRLSPSVSAD